MVLQIRALLLAVLRFRLVVRRARVEQPILDELDLADQLLLFAEAFLQVLHYLA